MELKFKKQKFQADAAQAIVDVFQGQPKQTRSYQIDPGRGTQQMTLGYTEDDEFIGYQNAPIVQQLSDKTILEHIQDIQKRGNIIPSDGLEGKDNKYNLTVEMETGTGKTYTYIKTMYELNKAYGWCKFIIVVPSIAIREGVYKTFQMTQEHFAGEYGKKVQFFIFNSTNLPDVSNFARNPGISAMIINVQAFNASQSTKKNKKGEYSAARRIYMELDDFQSRRPIDVIAKTNPILIIDEPQSVEGKDKNAAGREHLKDFHPLMILRYSATPREYYNLIYRMDAVDAYNAKLVKKIRVKGITKSGTLATGGYVYLSSVNVSKAAPTATVEFDRKGVSRIAPKSRILSQGDNLYELSGGLEEYKEGYVVSHIDGRDNSVEFLNGLRLTAGEASGQIDEQQLRQVQIHETIAEHLQREQQLFPKGIKVLSLFFIDAVAKYRLYDAAGHKVNGEYADMFEEEYRAQVEQKLQELKDGDPYKEYLKRIQAEDTHEGYFSVDKQGHMIDSKVKRGEDGSDDVSAYDLIMRKKELLLDRDPERSPVRFIFSHSALREGWDNPNVFQICTLKQSSSEVRKRQEVGRGLRLCVNQNGERQDEQNLGREQVQEVNQLTIIASESYESFAKGLQKEIADSLGARPKKVTQDFFAQKVLKAEDGQEMQLDSLQSDKLVFALIKQGYIDNDRQLTDKFREDREAGCVQLPESVQHFANAVCEMLDQVYNPNAMAPEDANSQNVTPELLPDKLKLPEFQKLWNQINQKTAYTVSFDTKELVDHAVRALDEHLHVSKLQYKVVTGTLGEIDSKEQLKKGEAFVHDSIDHTEVHAAQVSSLKYDLLGEIVNETGLTRQTVADILCGIQPKTFAKFQNNPPEFIMKAGKLINNEKAAAVIEHITYNLLDERYDMDIFPERQLAGKLGYNRMKANRHVYDHVSYDSPNERKFAEQLDKDKKVAVYAKLPGGFYISTPVGHYNPDWAIAFYEGTVKHIYFVAETKGSLDSMELREIEQAKIHCAREHFKAISKDNVVYDVVDNYDTLIKLVTE